jgi:hypothetical protein
MRGVAMATSSRSARALADHVGELLTLAGTGGDQVVERGVGERDDRRQHLVEAQAVVGEHARPAQQLVDAQRRGVDEAAAQAVLRLGELVEQRGVERHAARRGVAGLQVEAAFDLAAPQARGDALANRGFGGAQIVDDAKTQVEIARIDAAQLEVKADTAQVPRLDCEPCHALDHLGAPGTPPHRLDCGVRSGMKPRKPRF